MTTLPASINFLLPFSSLVCDLSSRFANINHSRQAAIVYQIAEPLLIYFESKSVNFHLFAKKLKGTFLPKFLRSESLLDKFFTAANLTSSLWTFGKLAQLINQNTKLDLFNFWKTKNISRLQFGTSLVPFAAALVAVLGISYLGAKAGNVLLNRENLEQQYKETQGDLPDLTKIRRKYPSEQNRLNSLHVFRLAMTTALAIFSNSSKEKIFFGINAACELLSWIQITKRKWYAIQRDYPKPLPTIPSIQNCVFKFSFRAYQFWKRPGIRYACSIHPQNCPEKNPDINICYKHVSPITCIFRSFITKIDDISKKNNSIRRRSVNSTGTLNRVRSTRIDISCSTCQKAPFSQTLVEEVHDAELSEPEIFELWSAPK